MTRGVPTRSIEKELWAAGHEVVVGIDEVGRGAWAGPLMVGAAVLPRERRVNGVRDSKMLTEPSASSCSIASPGGAMRGRSVARRSAECDELGMAEAQRLATRRALAALGVMPDAAVVDGKWNFVGTGVAHVELRVKADLHCLSVAAASILAKVTRDRIMREQSRALSAMGFRLQQGLSVPDAQGRAAGLRAVGDPSAHVGVHGSLRAVAGRAAAHHRRAADAVLR